MKKKKQACTISLTFKNKSEKDHFLGQMSDGWGENYVNIKSCDPKKDFYKETDFTIAVFKNWP